MDNRDTNYSHTRKINLPVKTMTSDFIMQKTKCKVMKNTIIYLNCKQTCRVKNKPWLSHHIKPSAFPVTAWHFNEGRGGQTLSELTEPTLMDLLTWQINPGTFRCSYPLSQHHHVVWACTSETAAPSQAFSPELAPGSRSIPSRFCPVNPSLSPPPNLSLLRFLGHLPPVTWLWLDSGWILDKRNGLLLSITSAITSQTWKYGVRQEPQKGNQFYNCTLSP